jgi:formate hydrogenlyase subunit 6/NADH:ubiquinone oxidoreductase subunit I
MEIDRMTAFAPQTRALVQDLAALPTPCIGCDGCQGVCRELIELITLPHAVLDGAAVTEVCA